MKEMCHRDEENRDSKLQGAPVTEARFDEMRSSTKAPSTDLRTLKQLQKNDHGYVSRQRPELVLMPNLWFTRTSSFSKRKHTEIRQEAIRCYAAFSFTGTIFLFL